MKSCFYKVSLLIAVCLVGTLSRAQIISTYAGTYGSITASGDGGAATAASVGNPNGVAVDRFGNVYFTDATNNIIRKVNTSGVISTFAGTGASGYTGDGGAATAATLYYPQGICADTFGNIYVADEVNRVVRKINTSGIITTVVGTGASGHSGDGGPATAATLPSAVDVAIDRAGNLYIADGYYSVRKVNTSGIISTFAGNSFGYSGDGGRADTATFNNPLGVDIDTFGNVYISDNQNMVIRKVDASGIVSTYAGNGYGAGSGMGGSFSGDGGPATAAGLDQPYGISVSRNGDLYIADQYNSVVRYVNATTGIIERYAGNNTLTYTGDGGLADTAGLNFPVDVAVDYAGNLFIADISNNVVRKVKAPYRITIATANDTVCSGTAVSYTSSVSAPVTGYHYHWFVNTTAVGTDAGTYVADSVHTGDVVKCYLIGTSSTDTLAISNFITMTVIPTLTPSVTYTVSPSASVCSGTSVTYSATGVAGGSAPVYHWSVNGTDVSGATTASYTYTPANGDVIQVRLNSSYACVTTGVAFSSTTTMTVTPTVTPTISISTASDTICTSTAARFTATITNGGATPHYQWFSGSTAIGSDTSSILYTPSSGAVISCRLTSNATCRTSDTVRSNYITMFVTTPLTPSITISTVGGDTSCTGMTDTFYASTVHGGSSPTYAWIVNGFYVSGGNPFVYSPASGDVVQCTLYPSGCVTASSVNSNTITLTVLAYTTPTVTISRSRDTVCAGDSVTFTGTSVSGGSAPIYSWYKNGTYRSTGTTYRDAPGGSDVYECVLVSNAHCNTTDTVTSSAVMIVVNPVVTPTVGISASPSGPVCAGTTVTFTAAPVNGGSAPAYTWYKNGAVVGSSATYSYVPVNNDTIQVKMVSSASCVTTSTVFSTLTIMVVNPVVTPSISVTVAPGDTVCGGTTLSFTSTIVNGGASPAYQWQSNGTDIAGATSTTYTYTPSASDTIVCRLISSNPCAVPDTVYSAPHRLVVNPVVTPAITATATPGSIVCVGTSVTYTATATGGGSGATYQWKVNGTVVSTATSYTYTPANGDVITCRLISNAPCRTADSAFISPITMVVNPVGAPSVTITSSPGDTICVGGTATFTPSTTTGGSSPTYKWFVNGVLSGTASTYAYTPASGDLVKCVMHSSSSCSIPDSATSNTITITVSSFVTPAVSIATATDTVCSGIPITFTPTPVNGGSAPVYNWYVNGTFTGTGSTYSYAPANGDIVKCTMFSSHPCASPDSAVSNSITMTVTPSVVPSVTIAATPGTTITFGTSVTFTATQVNGGSAPVYVWLLNGSVILGVTGPTYVTDTLYNGQVVTCVLLSNAPCANPPFDTSNALTTTITNVGVVHVNKLRAAIDLQPNPNNGIFFIKSEMLETSSNNAEVTVTDMLGKIVYRNGNLPIVNGKINSKIALDNSLANGLYMLNLKYDDGSRVMRFVIEK